MRKKQKLEEDGESNVQSNQFFKATSSIDEKEKETTAQTSSSN